MRLLHTLVAKELAHGREREIAREVRGALLRLYGNLRAYEEANEPVLVHFTECDDEEVLDFLEAWFRAPSYQAGQEGVDALVTIFREEGIGVDFTPFHQAPGTLPVARSEFRVGAALPIQFPEAYLIENQVLHQEVIAASLELLASPLLAEVNQEFKSALQHHRAGKYREAITACASAFESTMKIICAKRGWPYDSESDTCAHLVDICHQQGLFPSFYVDLFKRTGTIRNKIGSAHGKGPKPLHEAVSADSEHLLYMSASQIMFLCRLAGLY